MEFVDLKAQYRELAASIQGRMQKVLDHGTFIMGPEIGELEARLTEYTGGKHCVTCANGTDALLMVLMAKGVGPGDAVFTTPFTFIATAEVIALLGATPVYVDIDPKTFNIDPNLLAEAVESVKRGKRPSAGSPAGLKAKAVIPVDLFGLPADYDAIAKVAAAHGMFVLEDAAQSMGGMYHGRMACSLGDVGATSFFPAKPLGCYGDGGAIFTNDGAFADLLRSIRLHGKGSDKYDNIRIGINGRLDTLQAAVLLAKMEVFPQEVERRQRVAANYTEALKGIVETPHVPEGYRSAWAQYSILSPRRKDLMEGLQKAGVPTMIYYPKPLHRQTAFAYLGYAEGSLPISERISGDIFSLPMHPYLKEADQMAVVDALRKLR